ncbi:MAG: hypothetical protein ACI4KM_04480 [Oscillospiraceae bacterium]
MSEITNPILFSITKNAGIIDRYCKERGIKPTKITFSGPTDLQDVVNSDLRNMRFHDVYIFDTALCGDSAEFLNCMKAAQFQTDARIVVYAAEHYAGDDLLDGLISIGITNIVARYDENDIEENIKLMMNDLAECLSEDGLSHKKWRRYQRGYDPAAEARYEQALREKEAAKPTFANAKLKIAVIGAQPRIGTTTTAIHIADYFVKHKATAAICNSAGSDASDLQLDMLCDMYNGVNDGDHIFTNGISFYKKGAAPAEVNVIIHDFGAIRAETASQLVGFDLIYLVGGVSWSEIWMTYAAQSMMPQINYKVLVPFADSSVLDRSIEIEDEGCSTIEKVLSGQNFSDIICLPYAAEDFSSEEFESLFDKEFNGYRDTTIAE